MKKETQKKLLYYGISAGVGAMFSVGVFLGSDLGKASSAAMRYQIWCDAFTVPGVLLMLFGVLLICASQGAFDGIGYALKQAMNMLLPGRGFRHETYGDYVQKRHEKKAPGVWRYPVWTGAVYFAVALVFLALYYSAV